MMCRLVRVGEPDITGFSFQATLYFHVGVQYVAVLAGKGKDDDRKSQAFTREAIL
jgi:hypothetical protein